MPTDSGFLKTTDFAAFQDMRDAARFIVFHHPELLTLDPGVAAKILGYIESTSAFGTLVDSLNDQGAAQDPDSDYEGWANGEYLLDAQGAKIADGKGSYYWAYRYTSDTGEYLSAAVQQALLKVRDDAALEGIRFETPFARAGNDSGGAYVFDDENWRSGCRVTLESSSGRTITFSAANSQFRHLGVYVRFLDARGAPLSLQSLPATERPAAHALDTDIASFLGILEPQPLILGVALRDNPTAQFTVTLPSTALRAEILAGGIGVGPLPDRLAQEGAAQLPGAVLTMIMELVLPAFYLAAGKTVDQIKAAQPTVLTPLEAYVLEFAARPETQATFLTATSKAALDAVDTTLAWTLLSALIKDNAPALVQLFKWLGSVEPGEYLRVARTLLEAVAAVGTLQAMVVTSLDLGQSPRIISYRLDPTIDLNVTIGPPADTYQFPAAAARYSLTVGAANTTLLSSGEQPLPSPTVAQISHTFTQLPPRGTVQVQAEFQADNGWVAAQGASDPVLLEGVAGPVTIVVPLIGQAVPLSPATTYSHRQKLVIRQGRHGWDAAAAAPSATRTSLGGNMSVTLEDLAGIALSRAGRLIYAWQGKSPTLQECPTGAASTPLYTLQSIGLAGADPDAALKTLDCGYAAPLVFGCGGQAPSPERCFLLAPRASGAPGGTEYHAHRIDLTEATPFDLASLPSWGRFSASRLGSVAVHPLGVIAALDADNEKVELLRLPATPYGQLNAAAYAFQIAGQGKNLGRLQGARAIAIAGDTLLVLEEGNERIQAFDLDGNVVKYFNGSASAPLKQWPDDATRHLTYLDLQVNGAGYLYVLSYEEPGDHPEQYRLDIYSPDGSRLARTTGVAAARFVLDPWGAVYTLNYELLQGPNQRPEPSVSLWAAAGPISGGI